MTWLIAVLLIVYGSYGDIEQRFPKKFLWVSIEYEYTQSLTYYFSWSDNVYHLKNKNIDT